MRIASGYHRSRSSAIELCIATSAAATAITGSVAVHRNRVA
jgi:hypothetical protein